MPRLQRRLPTSRPGAVREEAATSSAMEGTYSTLDHLLELEESDDDDEETGMSLKRGR
jgi:hypothetical protein